MKQLFESEPARFSLASLTLMMIVNSIHHVIRLGYGLVIPAIILTLLPYALLRWYAQTRNTAIMKTYSFYGALMFLWFGFIDGFMDHMVKALGFQNTTFLPGGQAEVVQTALSFWSPQVTNVLYEGTGILTSVIGIFAMYYLVRMIQAKHALLKAAQLSA